MLSILQSALAARIRQRLCML
ncbi:hypothetical protein CP061683_0776A, partial [Chlamydia psittaci 06-1683]